MLKVYAMSSMIPRDFRLETKRLVLQFPSLEEVPLVISATKYEGFNDGMLWDPPENDAPVIRSYHNNIKAWQSGKGYGFSLIDRSSGDFIGRISIRREEEEGVWNIGFWTHPVQQGKGYMTEAVGAILRFGFEVLQAKRIEACYALWNKASERVLKKNGLYFLRYIEKGFKKKGQWVAENLMGIERIEWESEKNYS